MFLNAKSANFRKLIIILCGNLRFLRYLRSKNLLRNLLKQILHAYFFRNHFA